MCKKENVFVVFEVFEELQVFVYVGTTCSGCVCGGEDEKWGL